MSDQSSNHITSNDWLAVEKGDKQKAQEVIQQLAVAILFDQKLSRDERLRLGGALIGYEGDPVAFFGHGRRGPSATKSLEKIAVWEEVKAYKQELRTKGEKQIDAFADIAEKLDMEESTVKAWYEEMQSTFKRFKESEEWRNSGIASLLP
jgi:hypothetical protein